jgi:hypothetical protein
MTGRVIGKAGTRAIESNTAAETVPPALSILVAMDTTGPIVFAPLGDDTICCYLQYIKSHLPSVIETEAEWHETSVTKTVKHGEWEMIEIY